MMRPFEYVSPRTKAQAVSLLGAPGENTEILAGGTDLLALMKDDVVAPKRLVNIKDIKDLHGVTSDLQGLRIGALTTLGDLADDAKVKKNYPALADALLEAASPQIRNMATLGGNLASARAAGISATVLACCRRTRPAKNWCGRREPLSRHSRQ